MKKYQEGLGKLSSHTRFEVGDDSKIRFWHDVWCGDQALKIAFPKLFNIARFKEDAMADHFELSSASYQWNVNFLRAAHD
jgi:hypothetical protein